MDRIRTNDVYGDSGQTALPTPEARVLVVKSGEKGFEPLTFGFGDHCSTIGTIPLRCPRYASPLRTRFLDGTKPVRTVPL
jgi:hypothetical protein